MRDIELPTNDPEEWMQQCFNCEREECNDCHSRKRKYESSGKIGRTYPVNVEKEAKRLGITEKAFYIRAEKHGLEFAMSGISNIRTWRKINGKE